MDVNVKNKFILEIDGKILAVSDSKEALETVFVGFDEKNIYMIRWIETVNVSTPDVTVPKIPSPCDSPWTPVIPSYPQTKPTCSVCGLILDAVMGYCCPRLNCPTGMGPTVCKLEVSYSSSTGCGNGCAGCGCKGNE